MSEDTHSIELSADTWERLEELREKPESMDSTILRLLNNAEDNRVLFSNFTVFVSVGAVSWITTYLLIGETISNAISGLVIAATLFWFVWKELSFRGIFESEQN